MSEPIVPGDFEGEGEGKDPVDTTGEDNDGFEPDKHDSDDEFGPHRVPAGGGGRWDPSTPSGRLTPFEPGSQTMDGGRPITDVELNQRFEELTGRFVRSEEDIDASVRAHDDIDAAIKKELGATFKNMDKERLKFSRNEKGSLQISAMRYDRTNEWTKPKPLFQVKNPSKLSNQLSKAEKMTLVGPIDIVEGYDERIDLVDEQRKTSRLLSTITEGFKRLSPKRSSGYEKLEDAEEIEMKVRPLVAYIQNLKDQLGESENKIESKNKELRETIDALKKARDRVRRLEGELGEKQEIEAANKELRDKYEETLNELTQMTKLLEAVDDPEKIEEMRGEIEKLETRREELFQEMSLKDKVKYIFKKYGLTVFGVLTAMGTVIGVVVSNLKAGLTKVAKGVGNGLKELGKKLGQILPGMIGAIAKFLFNAAGEAIGFLAEHAWLLILLVVTFVVEQFKDRGRKK